MVYLGEDRAQQFDALKSKLKNKSTLIITNGEQMAKQGAAINFVVVDGHPKFEMNKAVFENHHLKVSSALATLAILV